MNVSLTPNTRFILSTSGSESALERHNTALNNLEMDMAYFTFGRPITSEEYAGLFRSPIVRGGAVTGQGLKTGIIPFVDQLDPLAEKLGSVNTIVNISGKLHGYNTDAFGFKTAISNYIERSDRSIKTAVVYGNGGVSGVAVRILQELGLKVGMAGRNQKRVDKKMSELGIDNSEETYDLVVNATPISSNPIEEAQGLIPLLKTAKTVFDHSMPEKEGKTNYLKEYCDKNNLDFISGNEMYIPQMIKQWTLLLNGLETKSGKTLDVSEAVIKEAWSLS